MEPETKFYYDLYDETEEDTIILHIRTTLNLFVEKVKEEFPYGVDLNDADDYSHFEDIVSTYLLDDFILLFTDKELQEFFGIEIKNKFQI